MLPNSCRNCMFALKCLGLKNIYVNMACCKGCKKKFLLVNIIGVDGNIESTSYLHCDDNPVIPTHKLTIDFMASPECRRISKGIPDYRCWKCL